MSKNKFLLFLEEAEKPFSGWDFSHIEDRMVMSPFKWSYTSKILYFIRNATSLLDMGTGGGEYLASLQPLPEETHATEAYLPNVAIARKKLEPIGVTVHQIDDKNNLPFEDNKFELVINRHEAFSGREIYRILQPDKHFITQQVGETNNLDINSILGASNELDIDGWKFSAKVQELKDAGFTIIEENECKPVTRIFDIGAVLYYLKAIPWQINNFSVDDYYDELFEMHKKIEENGYIDIHSHRCFVIAKKNIS